MTWQAPPVTDHAPPTAAIPARRVRPRPAGGLVLAGLVLLAAGCGGAAEPAPSAAPVPTTVATTTTTTTVAAGPGPVAVPGELRIGAVEIDRATTATVLVMPANRPVSFGRTELRGNAAYELTGDTCSRTTLRPADEGCWLEVTVLARATGDVAARLVLPWNRGILAVPVSATVPLSYTVTLAVLGAGTVTGDRAGIDCSGRCTARVAQGSVLTLTATGRPRWSGACGGAAPTCRVTVRAPLSITADFR